MRTKGGNEIMKRKLLAALCVTAMSASLLAGCGSGDKTEEPTKTEETTTLFTKCSDCLVYFLTFAC